MLRCSRPGRHESTKYSPGGCDRFHLRTPHLQGCIYTFLLRHKHPADARVKSREGCQISSPTSVAFSLTSSRLTLAISTNPARLANFANVFLRKACQTVASPKLPTGRHYVRLAQHVEISDKTCVDPRCWPQIANIPRPNCAKPA